MNDARDPHWQPDPHLLAAYFDGEIDSGGDCARIEAWLQQHPEAVEASADLQQLWLDTTPAEPSAALWRHTLDRIDAGRRQPSKRRRGWMAIGVAACVALVVGFGVWRLQPTTEKQIVIVPPEVEVFAVATADEVIVLHIEGRDARMLAVGTLPAPDELELAAPGEVRVFHARPDANAGTVWTVYQNGPRAPMIWAKIETD